MLQEKLIYRVPQDVPGVGVAAVRGKTGQYALDTSFGGRRYLNIEGADALQAGQYVMIISKSDFGLTVRAIPEGVMGNGFKGFKKPSGIHQIFDELEVPAFLPGFYARISEPVTARTVSVEGGSIDVVTSGADEFASPGTVVMVSAASKGSTLVAVEIPELYVPDEVYEYTTVEEWVTRALTDVRVHKLGIKPRLTAVMLLMGIDVTSTNSEGKARTWATVDGSSAETVCNVSFWSADEEPILDGTVVEVVYNGKNSFSLSCSDQKITSAEQLATSWDEVVELVGARTRLRAEPLLDKPLAGNVRLTRSS